MTPTDPRVVWITSERAAVPKSGGALRTNRLLRAVAARYQTSVVLLGDEDGELLRAETGVDHVTTYRLGDRPISTRWWAVSRRLPLYYSRLWSPRAASRIRELSDARTVLVCDNLNMAQYAEPERPHVISLQNAESALRKDQPPPRSPLRRLETRWDALWLRRQEQRALLAPAAQVVVVSASDAEILGVAAHVVPNGTDVPRQPPPVDGDGAPLFVGSLDYPPNRDALDWWAREVAPLLPTGFPKLTVVGRGGATGLGPLSRDATLNVAGEVDDVTPYLSAAGSVVVPLRHGGGTRLKVLEAFAWRRPVVSTSKGVEGIPLVPGVHALVVDNAAAFAEAVVRVHRDPELARRLSNAARIVAEAHDWARIGDLFVDVVRQAFDAGRDVA